MKKVITMYAPTGRRFLITECFVESDIFGIKVLCIVILL